jgi:hypothetical protein
LQEIDNIVTVYFLEFLLYDGVENDIKSHLLDTISLNMVFTVFPGKKQIKMKEEI